MKKTILPVLLIIIFVVAVIGVLLFVADDDNNDALVVNDNQNINSTENQDIVYLNERNDIYRYDTEGKLDLVYQPDIEKNDYLLYGNQVGNIVYAKINSVGVEERLVAVNLLSGEEDVVYSSDTKFNYIISDNNVYIIRENNQLLSVIDGNINVIVNNLNDYEIEVSDIDIPSSSLSFLNNKLINNKYMIVGGYTYGESLLIDVTKTGDDAFVKKLPSMYFYKPLTPASDSDEFVYVTYSEELEKEQFYLYSIISDKSQLLISYSDGGMRTINYENNEILVDLSDFVDASSNYYEAGQYIINSETQEIEKFDDICNIHNVFEGPDFNFSEDESKVAWLKYGEDDTKKLVIADYNDVDCFSSLKEYNLPDNDGQWYLFDYQN